MTERVPSDHPGVESRRVHLEAVGRTGRVRLPLSTADDLAAGDVVRLFLEGEAAHAAVVEPLDGDLAVASAFANARLARTGEGGTDRFRSWIDEHGLAAGDPLALDVLRRGSAYGVRRPGERVVYRVPDRPPQSLRDIARDLDG